MADVYVSEWDDASADFDFATFDVTSALATESLILNDINRVADPQTVHTENIVLTEVSPSIVALGVVKTENIKAYDDRVIGIILEPLTENIALADARGIDIVLEPLTENLALADSKALSAGVVKTENMIIADSKIIHAQPTRTESLALADTKTMSLGVIKSENVVLADDRDLSLITVKTENIVLDDIRTNWANLNEPTMFYARADEFDLKITPGVA